MNKMMMVAAAAVLSAGFAFAKEKVLVVSAHPDDAIAMAGTMYLMREKFEVHVVDLTSGQLGLGEAGRKDGSTAARRAKEEAKAMAVVGATAHLLDFPDGSLYASEAVCAKIAALIIELKPRAIFAMWPIDTHQDHSMAGTATLKAAWLAKYRGEFYYYEEVLNSKGFVPVHYVDVSDIADVKQRFIRCYECQNEGDYMNRVEMEGAKARGYQSFFFGGAFHSAPYAECRTYAECFAPLAGFAVQGDRCIFTELPRREGRGKK